MSAFLGPIHFWLYNKIVLQNELVNSICRMSEEGKLIPDLETRANERCGSLEQGELQDIVDEMNIHGWLQERVSLVESRLAYVVTELLKVTPDAVELILKTAERFGAEHAVAADITAEDAYQHMETVLLNGMPCDHVNEVTSIALDDVCWTQVQDIHAYYWECIGGDPNCYVQVRGSLIKVMLTGSEISYIDNGDQTFELVKKVN